jgi:hypothetical protein
MEKKRQLTGMWLKLVIGTIQEKLDRDIVSDSMEVYKIKSHVPIHALPQDRPHQWIRDNAPRFPPNNPDVSELHM